MLVALLSLGACITGKDPAGADGQAQDLGGKDTLKPNTDGAQKDAVKPNKDGGQPDSGKVPGQWKAIQANSFTMGPGKDEKCTNDSVEASHTVTLTRGFTISVHEVTQGQYKAVMGYNPSKFSKTDSSSNYYCGSSSCANNPVDSVSWHEAAAYCNELSKQTGKSPCYQCTGKLPDVTCEVHYGFSTGGKKIYDCPGYRLPTEAEWEFAYRAGTTTPFYHGGPKDSGTCKTCKAETAALNIAWYCANSNSRTHAVGQKMPNPWGLLDMAGNVWEWVDDHNLKKLPTTPVTDPWIHDNPKYRVIKGGAYKDYPFDLRGARRYYTFAEWHQAYIGFRPARTLP